jgi:oxygen-dependent protoporphyrinogen oxidase
VVGGGLAGLAAAEEATSRNPRLAVTVLESAGHVGGVLGSVRRDGWLVERAADCFLAARPEGVGLVSRLGIDDQLIGVDPRVRRALVWHRGRAIPVPAGFRLLAPGRLASILTTPLLSPVGRLRLLAERWVARRTGGEESLQEFAIRRLGREAFDRLVQPLAAGIWTADPARLGMSAACGEFAAFEQSHGSLWAGERARLRGQPQAGVAAGARYGQFVTFAAGMATLPLRLADTLRQRGAVIRTARVEQLTRTADGWVVTTGSTETQPREDLTAATVILAVPAAAAAALLAGLEPELSTDLAAIDYAGSVIVSLGFRRKDVGHPLDAAGLVVPRRAGRRALALSFSSSKFPGRAPPDHVLIRVFLGGALDPDAVRLDDEALLSLAIAEAAVLVGARGTPRLTQIDRWASSMPQYHVGHADRVARIEAAVTRIPRLALAGAAYRGVGIPQVIASGQAAANRLV